MKSETFGGNIHLRVTPIQRGCSVHKLSEPLFLFWRTSCTKFEAIISDNLEITTEKHSHTLQKHFIPVHFVFRRVSKTQQPILWNSSFWKFLKNIFLFSRFWSLRYFRCVLPVKNYFGVFGKNVLLPTFI